MVFVEARILGLHSLGSDSYARRPRNFPSFARRFAFWYSLHCPTPRNKNFHSQGVTDRHVATSSRILRVNLPNPDTPAWLHPPFKEWSIRLLPRLIRRLMQSHPGVAEGEASQAAQDGIEYSADQKPAVEEDFERIATLKARSALIDGHRRGVRALRPPPPRRPQRPVGDAWGLTGELDDWSARFVLFDRKLTDDRDLLTVDEMGVVSGGLYAEVIVSALRKQEERLSENIPTSRPDGRIAFLAMRGNTAGLRVRTLAELLCYESAGLSDRAGTYSDLALITWARSLSLPTDPAAWWNDLTLPSCAEMLGAKWDTESSSGRLHALRELELPIWESTNVTIPVALLRAVVHRQDLKPAEAFARLRRDGFRIVTDPAGLAEWVAKQLSETRLRFARLRRAELHAAKGLGFNDWKGFRWYGASADAGRPVAEFTLGVSGFDQQDEEAVRALAIFLGAEVVKLGSTEVARQEARRAGLDLLLTVQRTNDPPPPAKNQARGFAYHIQLHKCDDGAVLWESPAELENSSRTESREAHYQRAFHARRRALAQWRKLCVEAGLVPERESPDGEVGVMPNFGLSMTVAPAILVGIAAAEPGSQPVPQHQRELLVGHTIRVLLDPKSLADHTRRLIDFFKPTGLGHRFPPLELPPEDLAERVVSGGPAELRSLEISALALLMLNPIALYDLADRIEEDVPATWVPAWRML